MEKHPDMDYGSSRKNLPVQGSLYILGSAFMFAIIGALVRMASATLPNEMVVFLRNLFALIFVMPIFIMRSGFNEIRTDKPLLHVLRSAAGLSAMYCYFYALAHMKLAEAVLLSYTSPLIIPIIALLWLREPVPRTIRSAVCIGFVGVIFILKPGFGIFQPVALIALVAALFASLAMVTIRRMSDSEPPGRIVFYFSLLSTLISSIPLVWAWETPQGSTLVILVLVGIVAMTGQFFLTKGYSLAPAAQVGPFIYGTVVFAAIFGWIFWDESLDLFTWVGATLVCIAGIVATRRVEVKTDQ
jgi:drug/metabolite transporter (DMT)-like permease